MQKVGWNKSCAEHSKTEELGMLSCNTCMQDYVIIEKRGNNAEL